MRRVSARDPNDPVERTDSHGRPLEERSDPFARRLIDTYEDSAVKTDPRARPLKEAAPEVGSTFHERAFVPRGTLPPEEVLAGLRGALPVLELNTDALVVAWQPCLRQAVEQVAGDGVDAWVSRLRKPPGKIALHPFLAQLVEQIAALHLAPPADRPAAAERVIALVESALAKPMRVSLRSLERDLEGRVDLETLLATSFASSAFLDQRDQQLDETLESLRAQLKQMPGKQPEGMLWNFTRLKAEKELIALERGRRARELR